jgi:choline dehydrogenase-like flavoprotein
MTETDVLIVGSGPAGVAAAFPLVEAGLRVRMIDVGKLQSVAPTMQPYKQFRTQDQWQWAQLLGRDYEALSADHAAAVSPKFRIPRLAFSFDGFADAYRLSSENSVISGSLAAGGLSNAWGAGVGCFDDADLEKFPIEKSDLRASYLRLADRVGLSGSDDDDLSEFFGRNVPMGPPTAAGPALLRMLAKYHSRRGPAKQRGVELGRCRHAVLTRPATPRNMCMECGQCLWGCAEKAIYNSAYDLEHLLKYPGFEWTPDIFIEKVEVRDGQPSVLGRFGDSRERVNISARRILLACGAIGTGAIVLRSLRLESSIRLLSTPAAAFAAWLPASFGDAVPDRFFALGEIAFRVTWMPGESGYAFGAMFSTHGLPVTEFINRIPTSRRTALRISKLLLPSLAVGNCFFPGDLSDHRMTLTADDRIVVQGRFSGELAARVEDVRHRLAQSLRPYGAWMIPGTFTLGAAGADIHYAGTVPMRENPAPHESNRFGEVAGLPDVLVVDGAALSALPAKSHTFTIMANADRIATRVAKQLKAG